MREKRIEIKGMNVHYKTAGKGTPLLILHGWSSRSERWEAIAELLTKEGYALVIPDLPGFGQSDPPIRPWNVEDYAAFLEHLTEALHLKRFILLGHSFGGGVAVAYAARHQERIEKLLLVASAIRRRKTIKKRIFKYLAKVVRIFSFLPFWRLFRKAAYKYIIRQSDYPAHTGVMKETYLKIISQDLSPLLSHIVTPTAVLWGKKDDVVPLHDGSFIAQHLKNAAMIVFPEGNHDMEQWMPDSLAQAITKFLSQS